MFKIISSNTFRTWLSDLPDKRAAARIASRLDRIASGLLGDVKPVGGGISEIRIDVGPGYRVYFMIRKEHLIVLLCGGNKSSQKRDLNKARQIAETWQDTE